MGKQYIVMVVEVDDSGDERALVELKAPVEMLRQFAPSAVAAALGADSNATVTSPDAPAPVPTVNAPATQEKRRRRTKAEMEAERAAAGELPSATIAAEVETEIADHRAPGGGSGPEPQTAAYNPFG